MGTEVKRGQGREPRLGVRSCERVKVRMIITVVSVG